MADELRRSPPGGVVALVQRACARAYAMTVRPPGPEEDVEVAPGVTVPQFVVAWSESAPEEAQRLRARLPDVQLRDRSVLVVGRGAGGLALAFAHDRPRRIVAVDMAARMLTLARLRREREAVPADVELRPHTGTLDLPAEERFDVVLLVQAFRAYGAAPSSRHVEDLIAQAAMLLAPGGLLAIRFGPPWRSPFGGGIDSRMPWAHLLVPEPIVFDDFRRRRRDSAARSYEDIGVNRITMARFRRAVEATALECLRFDRNPGGGHARGALRWLAGRALLEEHLTHSVYGVWRRA